MHRALKRLVILGVVAAALAMVWPFVGGLLMEIVCGGILGFGTLVSVFTGQFSLENSDDLLLQFSVLFVFLITTFRLFRFAYRYTRKRAGDHTLPNTVENALNKNVTYIKSARSEGMPDVQIRTIFHNGGWSAEETDKAFALAA